MRRLKPALLFIWHYHRYWPANRKTINQCRYRPVSCISYEYGALANMFQLESERSHSSLLIHAYQAFRTPDWQHFYCYRSGFVPLPVRMVILGSVFIIRSCRAARPPVAHSATVAVPYLLRCRVAIHGRLAEQQCCVTGVDAVAGRGITAVAGTGV